MILERFDSLVFIGDYSLQTIYNGLNILLRQDLSAGALQTWNLDKNKLAECGCENQFVKQDCAQHFVSSSNDVVKKAAESESPYACHRTPHTILNIIHSPASADSVSKFRAMAPQVPQSNYKPVPIIHSVSPSTLSRETAAASLLEFVKLADESKRKTPMLWIGPSAAGHIDIKNRKGNQEIWDFDRHMEGIASTSDVDVLKMWNMTVQAESWDGLRFGEKVAITQAMMVVNWLSRLESS